MARGMKRATKAHFSNQIVPVWAQLGTAHSGQLTSDKKRASIGPCLLSVDEAAIHLNVSEKTVRRLIKAQILSSIRIGRLVRIQRNEIERFLAVACYPTDNNQNLTAEDGHK